MAINLQKFCNPYPGHSLHLPFNQGGFTNATNGHLLLRVPAIGGFDDIDDPDLKKSVGHHFNLEPAQWIKCPEIAEPEIGDCSICNGTGEAIICPECNGDGDVDLETDYNHYDTQECKTCGGDGVISQKHLESIRQYHFGLRGYDYKMECQKCNGTGKADYHHKGITVGCATFSDLYLSWLCQLPNCEIGPTNDCTPARFRFDGGEGLIMPRRPNE